MHKKPDSNIRFFYFQEKCLANTPKYSEFPLYFKLITVIIATLLPHSKSNLQFNGIINITEITIMAPTKRGDLSVTSQMTV